MARSAALPPATNVASDTSNATSGTLSPILRRPVVSQMTGLPVSTLYRYIKTGQFPKPQKLGQRTVGWFQSDIERWLAARKPA